MSLSAAYSHEQSEHTPKATARAGAATKASRAARTRNAVLLLDFRTFTHSAVQAVLDVFFGLLDVKLDQLRQSGGLTDEEYAKMKAKIVD